MAGLVTKSAPDTQTKSVDEQIAEVRKAADDNAIALKAATENLNKIFEAFKGKNDETKKDGGALVEKDAVDAATVQKMQAAIDAQMDEIKSLKLRNESVYGSDSPIPADKIDQKAALQHYAKFGDAGMTPIMRKALSSDSDPDGGFTVLPERSAEITRILSEASPIRAIARVMTTSAYELKKLHSLGGAGASWVGEREDRAQTDTPSLSEMSFPTMELAAMPAATQRLLDDANFSAESWLAEEVNIAFGEAESAAFVAGNGVGKPRGMLSYTNVANDSWAHGSVGYVATGASGAFHATNPAENIIDMTYSLKAGYRSNARYVMNRSTQGAVRKIKDGDGRYLWTPASASVGAMINGFEVVEAEDMPDIAAGSYSIAFGDFRRGYLIVDRTGLRVLRDPYSAKPYILFYTTKRVGGGIQDFDAIKLLKFAAS